nr:DUF5668 domain-containing protein [uncultured Roseateles sp.]
MSQRSPRRPRSDRSRPQDHVFMGLCLIVIGAVALAEQRGYHLIDWLWAHWPLAITAFGALRLLTARRWEQASSGIFIIALSGWFYACETLYLGMTYRNSWPVLLVGLGVWKLLQGAWGLRAGAGERADIIEAEQEKTS